MSQTVQIFLSFLVSQLPQIAIATVGLILVRTKLRGPHPNAYLYGTIGFALLLVASLWTVLSRTYIQASVTLAQDRLAFANRITMTNLAGFVVLTVSIVFIAVAVFADRDVAKSSRGAA